jgi:hypothetical protein
MNTTITNCEQENTRKIVVKQTMTHYWYWPFLKSRFHAVDKQGVERQLLISTAGI